MARSMGTTAPGTARGSSRAQGADAAATAASAPTTAIVAGLVVTAFFVAFGSLHYGFYRHNLLQDTPLYERYGDLIVHGGQVPYRDFSVEYPPGALPVFAAPSLVAARGDFATYRTWFELLMLACGGVASALVGVVLAVQRASRLRLVAGTLLAGLAPLALGPVVLSRFDLWPAMLTIAGVAALMTDRRRLAAVLLGCAVAAKLYPAVVVPLAIVFVLRRSGRREALVFATVAASTLAGWVLPFLVLAPHGVWSSIAGQASRPLQLESLGASFLLAAHQAWGLSLELVPSHGSDNLGGHAAHTLASVQGVLAPLAILGLWIAFTRGEATRDRFLRFCAATVCAFVVLGKVLSPQYLIWLIALVPLVRGRRGAVASALFVAAMTLTQLWFPQHYLDLAYGFDTRASWLVLARDLALLALLATLLARRRMGVVLVGSLTLAALAASVAAAGRFATSSGLMHSNVLEESGIASTCAHARAVPGTSSGAVRYTLRAFQNSQVDARCVTVTIRPHDHAQLFAAAYLHRFDPVNVRRGYLGDAGRCTNTPGTGPTLRFSFRVPARSRFLVEVEQCGSTTSTPRYALATSSTPAGRG